MGKRYSDEDFEGAVRCSFSMSGTLKKLGLKPNGGNYTLARLRIKKMNLDTSHWLGQAIHRGQMFPPKEPDIQKILVENSLRVIKPNIKKRLIREGLLENKCAICGISEWEGKPLSLQMDHINGTSNDHRIENLRLLCPNCHSQTLTFAGRKLRSKCRVCPDCGGPKGKRSLRCQPCFIAHRFGKQIQQHLNGVAGQRLYESAPPGDPDPFVCPICRGRKSHKSAVCKICDSKRRMGNTRIDWPSPKKLMEMVAHSSYTSVGKMLGVSDNAIRKHLQKRIQNGTRSGSRTHKVLPAGT